ncbi:MAG: phosphatidylserine decarboxylase [Nanoarchaeota archaeon]
MPILLFTAILALVTLAALFLLNFYRDPKRIIPKGNNIVSPADGRVISIIDTSDDEIKVSKGILGKIKTMTKDIADNCYVISIFMSPLDVHINRAPIEGRIASIKHTKGKFFKAYDLSKSFENEKNEIVIENKTIKVKVIQIAGFLARRILCYTSINKKVNKGDKIGMIALGSQATIIIPKKVNLKIKINDKVRAGESVIADLK